MSERNNLVYFLNSVKDLLPSENEKDFTKKLMKARIQSKNPKNSLFIQIFWLEYSILPNVFTIWRLLFKCSLGLLLNINQQHIE